MKIGHINYLNLLPFYQFLKKKGIKVCSSYPAYINKLFEKKQIEAAFISSIKAQNKKCFNVGIAAKKRVKSVLVCQGQGEDKESQTSNILAKILNQEGRVVIGDKAFKEKGCKDLAKIWFERYNLPFVFALFCVNKHQKKYEKLIKEFLKSKPKIPYYVLKPYLQKTSLSYKEAKEYLEKVIYYKLSWQERKALYKFWKEAKKLKKENNGLLKANRDRR
jgi:chorismate dehydratase